MPYTPSKLPKLTDPDAIALAQYFEDELQSLSRGLVENITELDLSPIFAAPKKPREGMIVYADGTLWNPGSGEGLYAYSSGGVWVWLEAPTKSFSVVRQVFTSSGTYTPTVGMVYCIIEAVGSGGGGGSAAGSVGQILSGAGGGSGGYSRLVASAATIGVSQSVTIGSAGPGGVAGSNNGTAGSDVSIGALVVAKGGSGGKFGSTAQVSVGGLGGVAGTGGLIASGAPGDHGFYNAFNLSIARPSGNGGSSYFGGGALGVTPATGGSVIAGNTATNYGGGGSGAATNNIAANAAGGDGSKGVVFITEYINA